MMLDRERTVYDAVRDGLADAANDPARQGDRIPDSLLESVRSLREPPPLSDAALHLVHSIATGDSVALSDAVHTNHAKLDRTLLRAAIKALSATGDERRTLECRAFVHYELHDAAVSAALPEHFDFTVWAQHREQNAQVTGAGYARMSAARQPLETPKGYLAQRPWLLQLVLEQSSTSKQTVDRWWHLVVPGLLNYLDTTDLAAKARGVNLVHLMAQRFGERVRHAGLVPVFEESVQPCLNFLPPLEDAARTKLVFASAVHCLSALAQLAPDAGTRLSRLNYIAREGCLNAFLHTYENVELTIYFFDTLREFIDTAAQSLTAVHLSGIVRVFTQVMTDPFIDASPPLAAAACRAMAAAIKWAWPRIDAYRYTILLGLTKANALDTECFELLRVSDEEKGQLLERVPRAAEEPVAEEPVVEEPVVEERVATRP